MEIKNFRGLQSQKREREIERNPIFNDQCPFEPRDKNSNLNLRFQISKFRYKDRERMKAKFKI